MKYFYDIAPFDEGLLVKQVGLALTFISYKKSY